MGAIVVVVDGSPAGRVAAQNAVLVLRHQHAVVSYSVLNRRRVECDIHRAKLGDDVARVAQHFQEIRRSGVGMPVAAEISVVQQTLSEGDEELEEVFHEVTLAGPRVLGDGQGTYPGWELRGTVHSFQPVTVEVQSPQRRQSGQSGRVEMLEVVVLQVQLLKRRQGAEGCFVKPDDGVVAEV